MQIVRLTKANEQKLLDSRRCADRSAERVAARIVGDVRRRGDAALFAWARRLDGVALAESTLWVEEAELRAARAQVSAAFLRAVKHAARNIRRVAQMQKPQPWRLEVEPGVRVGQVVRPLETIGCYIPGGRHALVSTLLMTAIPAQIAGVRRILVVCPKPNAALLAAAGEMGLREIARIGGAQAIAALAYGTRSLPRVEKLFGPGNRYVTAAKRLVSSDCAIDMLAGPTELIVLATKGSLRVIAADLLAQAEHDPQAIALLVTPSSALARAVAAEFRLQLSALPASSEAKRWLARNVRAVLAPDMRAAIQFVNRYAPEHLSLPGGEDALLKQIRSAGSIFLGEWSAQPVGDYASGSNHVLPTSGWARTRGGLTASDFVKCISVQKLSRAGLSRVAPVVQALAGAEGLAAHARAVEVRQ